MFTVGFFLAHLLGDYIFQDDAMAKNKTSSWFWAILHGFTYTIPYWGILVIFGYDGLIRGGWNLFWALIIIGGTHVVIDRYRLAKQLIWVRNQLLPKKYRYSWNDAKSNAGYSSDKPAWMSTWLMIIVDNTVHLLINALAIYFLLM